LSTSSVARPSPKPKRPTPSALELAEAEAVAALVNGYFKGKASVSALQHRLKGNIAPAQVRRACELLAKTRRVEIIAVHNPNFGTADVQVRSLLAIRRQAS
jgi:hypothetical protein